MSQSDYTQGVLVVLSRRTAVSEQQEPNVVVRLFPSADIATDAEAMGYRGSLQEAVYKLERRGYIERRGTHVEVIWITPPGKKPRRTRPAASDLARLERPAKPRRPQPHSGNQPT